MFVGSLGTSDQVGLRPDHSAHTDSQHDAHGAVVQEHSSRDPHPHPTADPAMLHDRAALGPGASRAHSPPGADHAAMAHEGHDEHAGHGSVACFALTHTRRDVYRRAR